MNKFRTGLWLRIAILNLFIVALLGTLMRYKIGFAFPWFDQKHLQHAHSHFAFIGWVTHLLYVLMVHALARNNPLLKVNKYMWLVIANLLSAYGMLFSFAAQGYKLVSIILLCVSVAVSYIFSVYMFSDLRKTGDKPYRSWFTAALWFNIISSLGTFSLGYMMATHNFDSKIHLASLYYYLHFQYNGFFFFACMGLLINRFQQILPGFKADNRIFWLFFFSCIPAYFLSVLWMKISAWVYVLVVISAIAQVWAWVMFLRDIKKAGSFIRKGIKLGYTLLLIVGLALSVKFLLQLGSVVPVVSKMAFGFRSVIIAYLHLILLAIISVFLITYLYLFHFLRINRTATVAVVLFVLGVYLNELILGVQGIASFSYTIIPFTNESLFGASALILLSMGLLFISQWGGTAITSPAEDKK